MRVIHPEDAAEDHHLVLGKDHPRDKEREVRLALLELHQPATNHAALGHGSALAAGKCQPGRASECSPDRHAPVNQSQSQVIIVSLLGARGPVSNPGRIGRCDHRGQVM